MLNYDGKVGAVGRIPSYMRGIMTTRIVKFDIEREDAGARRRTASASNAPTTKSGEAIGKIGDEAGQDFDGYTQKTRHARRRSCATSSRRATAGSAPAI